MGSTSREAMRVRGASKLKNSPARAPNEHQTDNQQFTFGPCVSSRELDESVTLKRARRAAAGREPLSAQSLSACLHEHFDALNHRNTRHGVHHACTELDPECPIITTSVSSSCARRAISRSDIGPNSASISVTDEYCALKKMRKSKIVRVASSAKTDDQLSLANNGPRL